MFNNLKKAFRILVDFATLIALLLVVFPIYVSPELATGVVIGLLFATMIWGAIAFENKNR